MSDDHTALAVVTTKLASLQVQESKTVEELVNIRKMQKILTDEREQILRQQSNIHSLPAELLLQIFVSFVDSEDMHPRKAFAAAQHCSRPTTLSHVCRLWRSIALSTSRLWICILFKQNLSGVDILLERSKLHPIHIYHDSETGPISPSKSLLLEGFVTLSRSRWHSVTWSSPEPIMLDILTTLNSMTLFPHLRSIDLSVSTPRSRDRTGLSIQSRIEGEERNWKTSAASISFPNLEYVRLSQISPSELPPTPYPSLLTLHLCAPPLHKTVSMKPSVLRMSCLCALLLRSQNLEELTLDDAIPLMDVQLRTSSNGEKSSTWIAPGARHISAIIAPIHLCRLTYFEWVLPPPKDMWRLLHIINMPSLLELNVCLNTFNTRWLQYLAGHISFIDSAQPVGDLPNNAVICLTSLEKLYVECLDSEGLCAAFRKIDFPGLKTLSLTFLPLEANSKKGKSKSITPTYIQLPRSEAIFRDPRMPNLTSLSLSNFQLNLDDTKSMLLYMPSLQELSLSSCLGAEQLICSTLSGLPLDGPESGIPPATHHWICPQLEHLELIHCSDIKFRVLQSAIYIRKKSSEVNSAGDQKVTNGRPLKPLRRRLLQRADVQSSGSNSTPKKAQDSSFPECHRGLPPQASRSLYHALHERVRPRSIRSVHVVGCMRISEAELWSLQDEKYGVETTFWRGS